MPFGFGFFAAGGAAAIAESLYLLYTRGATPFFGAYAWNNGFGTRYTSNGGADFNNGYNATWSKTGTYIATTLSNYTGAPPVTRPIAQKWDNPGFGTTYTNTGLENDSTDVSFNDAETYFAIGFVAAPYLAAYAWSSSGFGSRVSNPSTGIGNNVQGIDFNPAGNYVVAITDVTPFIHAYAFSAGWGTKVSDPATIIGSGGVAGVRFSNDGTRILLASRGTPYIHVYEFSAGFGTKYSNPASLPSAEPVGAPAWAFDDTQVAISRNSSNYAPVIYPWNGTSFGTRYTDPASLPTASGQIGFSKSTRLFANPSGNNIFVWAFTPGSGLGTKFADPGTLPGTGTRTAQFSPQ